MRKIVVAFLLLVSLLYSFDYSAKARITDEFSSLSIEKMFHLSGVDAMLLNIGMGNNNGFSPGLGISYQKEAGSFSWQAHIEDLFANYSDTSYLFGMRFPWGVSDLDVGLMNKSAKAVPYFLFKYHIGSLSPYFRLSNKVMFGINYGFNLDSGTDTDYFRMVYPMRDTETAKKTIVVKGYFLDDGDIFFNGQKISVRSDGMFVQRVDLADYGENEISIMMNGYNTGRATHTFKVFRKYPFFDISSELQKKWEKVIDVSDYPQGEEFQLDNEVTRGDFYLVIGRIMDLGKEGYYFKDYYTDVFDPELKDYLDAMYGKGILKTAREQFVPEKPILRQEALTLLSRFLPDGNDDEPFVFDDITSKDWVYMPANKLANLKVLDGIYVEPKGILTRGDFFYYLYRMSDYVESLKFVEKKAKTNIIQPIIIESIDNVENDFSDYSFRDIKLLNPKKNMRVDFSQFYVKGYAEQGLIVNVNEGESVANKLGRFAEVITLSPGMNKLRIAVNDDSKVFYLLFLKKFADLSEQDYDAALIEKLSTITGYRLSEQDFVPDEFVVKEELILTLFNMGYVSADKVKQMMDKKKKKSPTADDEPEYTYTKDAVKFITILTDAPLDSIDYGSGLLTRRQLMMIFSEVPEVKDKVRTFFEIKEVTE